MDPIELPLWVQYAVAIAVALVSIAGAIRLIPSTVRTIQNADDKRKAEIKMVVMEQLAQHDERIKRHISDEIGDLFTKLTAPNAAGQSLANVADELRTHRQDIGTILEMLKGFDRRQSRVEKQVDGLLNTNIGAMNERALNKRRTDLVRALMVDDNESFSALVRVLLDGSTKVGTVAAVESINDITPDRLARADVIFLDLSLYETEGVETIRACRAKVGMLIPVIVLSGSDEWTTEECIAAGASGFVSKSEMSVTSIEEAIEAVMDPIRERSRLRHRAVADD